MNAKKHGERSAEAVARRRELTALYRLVRDDGDALRAIMREKRGLIDG
jgi:hypothetical protein